MRILLFLCGWFWLTECGHPSQTNIEHKLPEKPNIILIMADDLGYGDLPSYGNDRHQTPNLDYIASNGIRFTNFHSNGVVCSPTRASLLTGKYPQRTGITGVVTASNHRHVGLPVDEVTIADYLRTLDYRTGLFGKWHLGYDTAYSPLNQGFEIFKGFVSGNVDYHSHYDQTNVFDWWENKQLVEEQGYTTDLITESAVSFIDQHNKEPFFLYLAYAAPHYPYQDRSSPPGRGPDGNVQHGPQTEEDISNRYSEMIRAMDEGVGNILQTLKNLELTNQTIIFFLSDNGANERGSNLPYKGQKGQVWEGGHRVPAMCFWGDNLIPSINKDLVMTMDIYPTIVLLTDHDHDILAEMDGESFLPILQGQSRHELNTRYVYWKTRNGAAVRKGPWKLGRQDEEYFLYHLDDDAKEVHNLMDEMSEEFETLKVALERWEEAMKPYPTIS